VGRGTCATAAGAGAGNATSVEVVADFEEVNRERTDFEPGAGFGQRTPPPAAEGAEEAEAEAGRELGCGLGAGRGFWFAVAAAVGGCDATLHAAAWYNSRATRWLVQRRMIEETAEEALPRGSVDELQAASDRDRARRRAEEESRRRRWRRLRE
jgi:hypothetical protein